MNIISEIQDITVKVSSFEEATKKLQNDADKFVFQAEKKNDLSIFSETNSLKRAAIDKEGNLSELKLKNAKLMELKQRL